MKKLKTYVLMISKYFPAWHSSAGALTCFEEKVRTERTDCKECKRIKNNNPDCYSGRCKRHTIRQNYELWKHRVQEVQNGNAIISVRRWDYLPYKSPQLECASLDKDDSIGVQKLEFVNGNIMKPIVNETPVNPQTLAANDGLSFDDWLDWFKSYDLTKPMIIIHFTSFRY